MGDPVSALPRLVGRGAEGDVERAKARLQFAVSLDPKRRPLRELYGPDIAQAHLEAVDAIQSAPARPVTLDLQPADGRVLIDCNEVDPALPLALPPGLHSVHVAAPGYLPAAAIVDTTKDSRLSLAAVRSPAPPVEAFGTSLAYGPYYPLATSYIDMLRTVARDHGATAAIIVVGGSRKYTAQAVGPASVGRRLVAEVGAGGDSAGTVRSR